MNERSRAARAAAGSAEPLRQAVDLEHWPAFRASFDRLAAARRARRRVVVGARDGLRALRGRPPQLRRPGRFATPTRSRVYQLTCSPVRNGVPWFMEYVFRLGWSRGPARAGPVDRAAARGRAARAGRRGIGGRAVFGNTVATLEIDGRTARVLFEQPVTSGTLEVRARLELTR